MDSNIGKKLDGRYELLELIGVGGMADIYRANDLEEDRIVAVKILKTEFAGSDEFLRRFRNESKAIALLSHQNIVKIYDVGFTDKVQFIVMEYVDGVTLTDYIEQQGLLKWRDAVHFTVQILRALQHAHDRGIVHRDVKSSNVMLLRDGTIKVMDFGIARFNRENNKTMSDKTIGSVHYISPEQARGDITDERSDIYSVGVVLYEMLTGKKPFDGDNPMSIVLKHMQSAAKKPSELNSTIPEGLEQIVMRAMQKEPLQRYQTAGEMIKDLEDFKKNPGIVFEYKYNSVDGTAKYVDESAERSRRRKEPVEEQEDDYDEDDYDDDDEDEYEERRSPLIPILFAVGTAFVIMTVFLVLMLVSSKLNKTTSDFESVFGIDGESSQISITDDEFPMPNLIGLTWDEAVEKYSAYINLTAQQEWSTVTKGEIFDQDFVEGRNLKVGTTVTVKVSKGIKEIEIQDFTDRTVDAAEKQLQKDGFKVSKTYVEDDNIAENHVIRTIPEAHEMAAQGSTVVLVVSMGPEDTIMYMQNFVGMPIDEVLKRCTEYYLNAQVENVDTDEYEKGTVIEQSIEPNTQYERNEEVILKVSTGEIPEYSRTVTLTIPKKATGKFTFEYYIDGVLQEEFTETRDVSLSASKSIKCTVTGIKDEVKQLAVVVTSSLTGKSDTYAEVDITFDGEKNPASISFSNAKVFEQLLDGAQIDDAEESGESSDTNESYESTESSESSEALEESGEESNGDSNDDSSDSHAGGIPVE